jgi:phosphatidylglycerophosphatase GEP4
MSQSFNPEGIKFFFQIISSEKRLVMPHYHVTDISRINPKRLRDQGVEGIIFDKDNTLTNPYEDILHPRVRDAFAEFKSVFGDEIVIMSNSAGTKDDKNYDAARRIESALGVEVLIHDKKKPGGIVSVRRRLKCPLSRIAMAGDRTITDIAFGNKNGMLTILTDPFTEEGDNTMAAIFRRYERFFLRRWSRRGVTPPPHALWHPGVVYG